MSSPRTARHNISRRGNSPALQLDGSGSLSAYFSQGRFARPDKPWPCGRGFLLPGGERLGFKLFFSLATVFISGWFVFKTIRSGRFEAVGFDFTRDEQPLRFLAGVVASCFLCALFSLRLAEVLIDVSRAF